MSSTEQSKPLSSDDYSKVLYDKTVHCPICGQQSTNKAVKSSAIRVSSRDTDSMIYYSGINPSFYEVVYCTFCGYAALPAYFEKVKPFHVSKILEQVTKVWVKPSYPDHFDAEFAIKQLKLALHISLLKDAKDSEKGLLCLKLSWLYRLIEDQDNERRFQEQTLLCFENAYMNEKFPVAGMDEFSFQYLIGELYRRTGNSDKALLYYSKVLTSNNAPARIKDKVRDQKDILTKELNQND